ncbi:DUF485 domain-containing protein [Kineococcus rubinsiae]|uniref:DUF485 domain-containing protein n=1 Tax=Kineococcus rubinsiae TaxID=2609562 RepID=UPI001431E5FF|nr:DUF485 domain-containing protein [Kineococcus rubinsiae]NIZ91121.1 DUF485 domain-containing protein [Kineococcus rubinsiae]
MSPTQPRPAGQPGGPPPSPGPTRYERALVSPEFVAHRRRFRRFVLPLSALFLAWYATYVLLADYAHDFMSQKVGGSNITVGLLFGVGQFVSTFAITTAYVVWANKRFDPAAEELRERIEADALTEER